MTAPAQRLATHRADVTIRYPDGREVVEMRVAVRVKDGRGILRRGGLVIAEMGDVTEVVHDAAQRRSTVRDTAGVTWDVQRPKCGGCTSSPSS